MDAYSPQVLETLRTLIAPGGRMRLSPFVEEAQLRVLFGSEEYQQDEELRSLFAELSECKSRFETIRAILDWDQRRSNTIRQLCEKYAELLSTTTYLYIRRNYQDESFLKSFLIHDMPLSFCKVQLAFFDLISRRPLPESLHIVDIGIGVGNAPTAIFDLLLVWADVCKLYGVDFPIKQISYAGFDRSQKCIDFTRKIIKEFVSIVRDRLRENSFLDPIIFCANNPRFNIIDVNNVDLCHLNTSIFPFQENTVLVICNVLSELSDSGKNNLINFVRKMPRNSYAIVIEPGDENRSKNLNRWRRGLLQDASNLETVLACGMELGHQLSPICEECWKRRQDYFHQPQLFRYFCEIAVKLHPDRRSFDEYENNLLSWSYTVVGSQSSNSDSIEPTAPLASVQGSIIEGIFRYMGIVPRGLIKLCPAVGGMNVKRLFLRLAPEFTLPPVRYGDRLLIRNARLSIGRDQDTIILRHSNDTEIINIDIGETKMDFSISFTDQNQHAVENIACRFFGLVSPEDEEKMFLILSALLFTGITIVMSCQYSLIEQHLQYCNKNGIGDLATTSQDVLERQQEVEIRMEKGYYKIFYVECSHLDSNQILSLIRTVDEKLGARYRALGNTLCQKITHALRRINTSSAMRALKQLEGRAEDET